MILSDLPETHRLTDEEFHEIFFGRRSGCKGMLVKAKIGKNVKGGNAEIVVRFVENRRKGCPGCEVCAKERAEFLKKKIFEIKGCIRNNANYLVSCGKGVNCYLLEVDKNGEPEKD